MAIQFFTEKDLIKYGWEKSGYSINEFYEGEYDDLPEKMFANEEETAKYIMMEDKPEKLGLTRHAFFMKTIPKKLKELNDNFSYNLFSYKIFIKRYTALFLK